MVMSGVNQSIIFYMDAGDFKSYVIYYIKYLMMLEVPI